MAVPSQQIDPSVHATDPVPAQSAPADGADRDLSVPEQQVSFEVTPAFDSMRLDLYLKRHLSWRSRNAIQTLIKGGSIRVNGELLKAGRRVYVGDHVTIDLDPIDPSTIRHHEIPLAFLYEDEHIAVLDKQPGIIVHPVSHQLYNTLINAIYYHYRTRLGQPHVSPRLGHRLDRNTSGVLLISKNKDVRRTVQEIFESHRVQKAYVALVHGSLADDEGLIDAPLAPEKREFGGVRMVVRDDGSASSTRYRVLERFESYTYVRLEPKTGRTHQLRVHMQHLGHPILCDDLYGRESALGVGGRVLLDRQALHSCMLRFPHPVTEQDMNVECDPPGDMTTVLDALRKGHDPVSIQSVSIEREPNALPHAFPSEHGQSTPSRTMTARDKTGGTDEDV